MRDVHGLPGDPAFMSEKATSIFIAHIDVVHGCQLRCVGCPNSTLKPKIKRMPLEDFRQILGNIDVDKIHTLRLFNYGEPLLHPNLSELVSIIPEQRFSPSFVEISTNAQHVYWDDFEDMLKQEVINRIVVSCDGDGTPESYEALRPPGKWDKFIEFLERTAELKEKWSPALHLITRSVVTSEEDKERWREVLRPRGWQPEFRRWMALPEAEKNMTGREIDVPDEPCFFLAHWKEFVNHPWFGQVNLLYVDYDGTVVPCCQHPRAGVFGNLREQTFNEILFGEARQQFKDHMKTDRKSMPVCGSCDVGPVGREGPSFAAGVGELD